MDSPDCRAGKHRACHGDSWNYMDDCPMPCPCACHDAPALTGAGERKLANRGTA